MSELLWTVTVLMALVALAAYAADRVPQSWADWFAEVLR